MTERSYSELKKLETFEERFQYLKLDGVVGVSTLGFDRWITQEFYHSYDWQRSRNQVILRDLGCDLGIIGYEIHTDLLIHHMNPMTAEDVIHGNPWILDPEYLILTTKNTHNAIHYGNENLLPKVVMARVPNDTKLW